MRKLFFPLPEVLRIAEATVLADSHRQSFADNLDGVTTGPSLVWAKDQGTYLLSSAVPRPDADIIYARADAPDGLLLQLPQDTTTNAWDEVYSTTGDICGGDDFAEFFELDELLPILRDAASNGRTHFVLEISDETIELVITKEKR